MLRSLVRQSVQKYRTGHLTDELDLIRMRREKCLDIRNIMLLTVGETS